MEKIKEKISKKISKEMFIDYLGEKVLYNKHCAISLIGDHLCFVPRNIFDDFKKELKVNKFEIEKTFLFRLNYGDFFLYKNRINIFLEKIRTSYKYLYLNNTSFDTETENENKEEVYKIYEV
jgi:hypothetical protein